MSFDNIYDKPVDEPTPLSPNNNNKTPVKSETNSPPPPASSSISKSFSESFSGAINGISLGTGIPSFYKKKSKSFPTHILIITRLTHFAHSYYVTQYTDEKNNESLSQIVSLPFLCLILSLLLILYLYIGFRTLIYYHMIVSMVEDLKVAIHFQRKQEQVQLTTHQSQLLQQPQLLLAHRLLRHQSMKTNQRKL